MKTSPVLPSHGFAATERVIRTGPDLPALLFARAMIDSAIKDAICSFREGQPSKTSADAMAWISRRDYEPASFGWCCVFLDLDADKYRQQVLADIWRTRLAMRDNEAAIRNRFKAYSPKQTRQVRRPVTNLPDRDRPAGSILAG